MEAQGSLFSSHPGPRAGAHTGSRVKPGMTTMHRSLSQNPDLLMQYSKDLVYEGHPDSVYRGCDLQETAEVLAWANAHNTPVTFCGSQTAMTGSGVANSGIALTLNPKDRVLDIGQDEHGAFVWAEPGITLGELKQHVWNEGFFYPPDPTSYKEARLGGTIATNATGSDTYKYGPTRQYVEELEVLTASGETKTLKRNQPLTLSHPKNTAGYFLGGEEIDEVIGSEGTLALITKAKLRLLSNKGRELFYLVLPFDLFENCLQAVLKIQDLPLQPRALELIGPGAAEFFQSCEVCPTQLQDTKCFLYIKDEYAYEQDQQTKLETWFEALRKIYKSLGESHNTCKIFAALSPKQQDDLHTCRHHIPLKVNETFFPYTKVGGGKISTDWWVPDHHMLEMMLTTYEESCKNDVPFLVFAHIGNGHPHWNYLCKTPEEHTRSMELVKTQCQRAALYGGGVAGEHGIGKIKRYLLPLQHSPKVIAQMKKMKQKWDPAGILGQGNLF